jgi:hypothetical protein
VPEIRGVLARASARGADAGDQRDQRKAGSDDSQLAHGSASKSKQRSETGLNSERMEAQSHALQLLQTTAVSQTQRRSWPVTGQRNHRVATLCRNLASWRPIALADERALQVHNTHVTEMSQAKGSEKTRWRQPFAHHHTGRQQFIGTCAMIASRLFVTAFVLGGWRKREKEEKRFPRSTARPFLRCAEFFVIVAVIVAVCTFSWTEFTQVDFPLCPGSNRAVSEPLLPCFRLAALLKPRASCIALACE